jgi:hypothetical protein
VKRILLLIACLLPLTSIAQNDWRETLRQWLMKEDIEENYGEETLELFEQLAADPINLNQTSREELEQLPFLSEQQVEGLVEYIDRHSPIRSLSELQVIKALDYYTRHLLQHFVYVGEMAPRRLFPPLDSVAKYGRHTLMATGKIPFYERRGDRNGYLGYRYRHDFRYQFNYNNRVKFGLTAAQDAGEPFFTNRNKWGYDHYSYYFQLRDIGRLKELNVGMYRVQMGMGLLMNTGFYLGKLAMLQSLGRSSRLLTAYSSRSSANYLQGAAATVQLSDHWQVMAFASSRPVDATLNMDGTARTLVTDGYHRTPTEMEKKNNTRETDLGGRIGWRQGSLYVNANAVYTHFDRSLQPQTATLYRRYAATGSDFLNISLDYGYTSYPWSFAGETALNRKGSLAAIHSVSLKASDTWSLMLLHRYYDKRYTALHSSSFREGSSVQNEHGVYLGATWQPSWSWQLQGYVDYAHFPWARYLVSAPSDAFDALLSATCRSHRWTLYGRYRFHLRQRDDSEKKNLLNRTEHRLRFSADYSINPQLTLHSQADAVASQFQGKSSRGVMVGEQLRWQWKWLRSSAVLAWFCTDDYDSRLYQYEPSVRYDFSFPAYYGRGLRSALQLRADVGRFSATAKVGITRYLDRSVIGTGLQQVNHSSLCDLLLQLSCQL